MRAWTLSFLMALSGCTTADGEFSAEAGREIMQCTVSMYGYDDQWMADIIIPTTVPAARAAVRAVPLRPYTFRVRIWCTDVTGRDGPVQELDVPQLAPRVAP